MIPGHTMILDTWSDSTCFLFCSLYPLPRSFYMNQQYATSWSGHVGREGLDIPSKATYHPPCASLSWKQ